MAESPDKASFSSFSSKYIWEEGEACPQNKTKLNFVTYMPKLFFKIMFDSSFHKDAFHIALWGSGAPAIHDL